MGLESQQPFTRLAPFTLCGSYADYLPQAFNYFSNSFLIPSVSEKVITRGFGAGHRVRGIAAVSSRCDFAQLLTVDALQRRNRIDAVQHGDDL